MVVAADFFVEPVDAIAWGKLKLFPQMTAHMLVQPGHSSSKSSSSSSSCQPIRDLTDDLWNYTDSGTPKRLTVTYSTTLSIWHLLTEDLGHRRCDFIKTIS